MDNIPGVPGVGPKTATDLLQQFGTVDALYSRLAEVKSDRVRTSLAASEKIVRRNQRLIRLREEQPPMGLDEAAIGDPQIDRLRGMFADWGFKTMLAQLGGSPLTQGALL